MTRTFLEFQTLAGVCRSRLVLLSETPFEKLIGELSASLLLMTKGQIPAGDYLGMFEVSYDSASVVDEAIGTYGQAYRSLSESGSATFQRLKDRRVEIELASTFKARSVGRNETLTSSTSLKPGSLRILSEMNVSLYLHASYRMD